MPMVTRSGRWPRGAQDRRQRPEGQQLADHHGHGELREQFLRALVVERRGIGREVLEVDGYALEGGELIALGEGGTEVGSVDVHLRGVRDEACAGLADPVLEAGAGAEEHLVPALRQVGGRVREH
ncbi:hypothetical protein [Streptomyces sp. NPDC002763]|uniref:hypothetical protein n=1 Tax=Streptomyces sp. NPDC002763 TaxID=3154427 RepID=UPI0033267F05